MQLRLELQELKIKTIIKTTRDETENKKRREQQHGRDGTAARGRRKRYLPTLPWGNTSTLPMHGLTARRSITPAQTPRHQAVHNKQQASQTLEVSQLDTKIEPQPSSGTQTDTGSDSDRHKH